MRKHLVVAAALLFTTTALGARRKAVDPGPPSSPGSWYTPVGVELKIDGALRMTLGQLSRIPKSPSRALPDPGAPVEGLDRYPAVVERRPDGGFLLPVFVKAVDVEHAKKAIETAGGSTSTVSAGIIVARIPAENVLTVASAPSVELIGASHRKKRLMDLSRPEMRVDAVQDGTGLPQAYKGTGVVVGVVDSGIDLAHKDFQDANGKTRVLYLWDELDAAGPAPSGYTKGSECTKAQIDAGSCREKDTDGHGTHVTGTAAGNGSTRSGAPYRGVAPEADIIFVKDDESDTGIVDGCSYIFQKAAALGKPAVCNLSLGGHEDPHDGSSFLDSMLDGLQGVGKVVVAANGNEGSDVIHLGYDITGANYDTGYSSYLTPVAQTVNVYAVVSGNAKFGFYVYGSSSNPIGELSELSLGTTGSKSITSGSTSVCTIQYDATATAQDGSRVLTFVLTFTQDPTNKYSVELYTYGSGHLDAWVSDVEQATWDTETGTGIWPGDTKMTVGSPATGKRTLGVGAYVSKTSWIDASGKTQNDTAFCGDSADTFLSSIACFSSLGPTRDGRTKPDISAPGMYIVSTLSKDSTQEATDLVQGGSYVVEQGTSMSTPHVVGLVALMLLANPSLTTEDVKSTLKQKARSDSKTGAVPNNTWGWGKADAFESVKAVAGTVTPTGRTLTVTKSGSGTGTVSSNPTGISCGTTCSASFSDGSLVTLTASADPGSSFAGWSGDCFGSGSCLVTMSQARSVTATFSGGGTQATKAAFVLASARAAGAGGAFYTTDLTVANTGSVPTTAVLKFLGNNGDGRGGAERSFTIAGGAPLTISDVLASVFGLSSGFGAIRIASPSDDLRVIAQTSTPGFGGTFGQSVPAARPEDVISGATSRSILGVREDGAFRTNLILTNTTENPVEVSVTLGAENGSTLATKRYTLPPLGMTQVSRVIRDLGIGTDISSARLILSTATSGGAFAAYASVIDNITNDPRTLLPR